MPDLAYIASAKIDNADLGGAIVVADSTVKVAFTLNPAVKATTVNLQDISGPKIEAIDPRRKTQLLATWTVPATSGKRTLQVELRGPKGQIAKVQFVVFVVAAGTAGETQPPPKPDTDAPPTPTAPAAVKLTGTLRVGLSDLAHASYSVTKEIVAQLRLVSFRVWYGSQNFGAFKRDSEVANALTYERVGMSAIYCVAQDGMTPAMAANAPKWIVGMIADLALAYDADPATRGRMIRVEVGNEPDLKNADGTGKYWTGTIDQYIAMLLAVYVAVKASPYRSRVQIIAAGFSWNVGELERVAPTMALACDAIAFHGYPDELTDDRMARYARVFAVAAKIGKPVIITEACPGFGDAVRKGKKTVAGDWASGWPVFLAKIEALAAAAGVQAEAIIFNARNIGSQNSAGAMCTDDWKLTACGQAVKAAVAA